ncbi:GntR family transcriptional regulator [uncultured Corynebacterium sp.]|uniref:GntR family transcriptional regulator n=1 Tax=uncultured Corynebacterium sp. TaxID=159447 RepID=UPI0025D4F138|nr:GntR family transcriptional regulator [uncultured Corynebacterium sp.]
MRRAISAGEYSPGAKLNEVAVAEQLGVSRNTLREGFAELAADGIVDRIPHRGVFIASPTPTDILALYRARAVVEPGALLWGDALNVDALDRVVADAEASLATHDTGTGLTDGAAATGHSGSTGATALANQVFHRTVVEAAGSDLLNGEMDRLLARMRLVFLTAQKTRPTLHSEFVPVNRRIVTLLRAGDRAGAAETLRASLTATGEDLAATVSR